MRPIPIEAFSPETVGEHCLVTGGAGYLGRHLVDALLTIGCRVTVLDVVSPTRSDVGFIQGDIRDESVVSKACEGVDTLFHAAAVITLLGIARPAIHEQVFGINVDGTRILLSAARRAGVSAFVYTSSANVVIDRVLIEADEDAPYARRWVDLYGQSKAEAEALVLAASSPEMPTTALRPGGIWGPGDGGFMVRAFLSELAAGRFVATIGDGEAVVDNTHVSSLVFSELLAAKNLRSTKRSAAGLAFFITDDERVNGITWFRPLCEGLGYDWPTRRIPGRPLYAVAWAMEVAHFLGASAPSLTRIGILKLIRSSSFRIDRARSLLDYVPLVKHEDGLRAHLDDYRATLDSPSPR